MFPNPLMIGPLALNFYGLMVALGVLAALVLFRLTAPTRGLTPGQARDFCFWMILAGLIGSRLFYVLFHWPEFAGQPASVLAYWRGGLMFQGGVLTALAVAPFFLRRYQLPFWPTADVMAPSLALGQCFGRLGCFGAGCCYGQVTGLDNPLGVIFPPNSLAIPSGGLLPLWPTQLMESFGLLVLALLLTLALVRPGRQSARFARENLPPPPVQDAVSRPGPSFPGFFSRPGRVAALYLFGSGLLRLVMELFFRGDYRGDPVLWGLPPTTLTAIMAAFSGLLLLIWFRPRPAL